MFFPLVFAEDFLIWDVFIAHTLDNETQREFFREIAEKLFRDNCIAR